MPPELVMYRSLTSQDLCDIGQHIITGDIPFLEDILKRAKADEDRPTVLQVWIASCAIKAIRKGDVYALNELLNRFVGKVPIALDIRARVQVHQFTDEEARDEAERIMRELSEHKRNPIPEAP